MVARFSAKVTRKCFDSHKSLFFPFDNSLTPSYALPHSNHTKEIIYNSYKQSNQANCPKISICTEKKSHIEDCFLLRQWHTLATYTVYLMATARQAVHVNSSMSSRSNGKRKGKINRQFLSKSASKQLKGNTT